MSAFRGAGGTFGAMTTGAGVSMLKAPHVPSGEVAASGAGFAFLGFAFDRANAAIERPGSANGPLGLRIASNFYFPRSFKRDIDLEEVYGPVACGDCPIAVGNAVRTHRFVEREILKRDPQHTRRRGDPHPGRQGIVPDSRRREADMAEGSLKTDVESDSEVPTSGIPALPGRGDGRVAGRPVKTSEGVQPW
jgi:hypothetical protein